LALARAVYQNCEIYLLDDPFASLDRTVGRHIFQNCIQGILKARGALVLLCTHQPDFLRQADWIIQLGPNGGITNQGVSLFDVFLILKSSKDFLRMF
jgi:ABC-type transport system involved in cytochrome bd biosynthesis fused ATPase/permease subunit